MKQSIFLFTLLLLVTSCKTREDIEREKLVQDLSTQMKASQQVNADATAKLQELQERIGSLTGKVEETDHQQSQTFEQKITALEEKIKILEESNKARGEQIDVLSKQVEGQSKYIKEVLATLNKLSGSSKKGKSRKKLSPYDSAMSNYRRGRYKTAKDQLLALVDNKKIKGSKKARIIHNLGMIEFIGKRYDSSVVYFSRLFTEHSKSGYNKNGLLFLGKSFKQLGKKDEAKQTLQELINRFPKDKKAKEAKKLIKSL